MSDALSILDVTNPWLSEPSRQTELLDQRVSSPFIERDVELDFGTGRVLLVVGPRQVGKSTLLLHSARELGRPVVILNAEESLIAAQCRSAAQLMGWLRREVLDEPALIIIEEVQHLREAGLLLKGLVDLRTPHFIVATGSSGYHLRARTRESLAGRAERVRLLPFSHQEVLTHERPAKLRRAVRAREVWERQLQFGGYPTVWLSQTPERELVRLSEAFIIRDASDVHQINRTDAFRRLLGLLAADQGSTINVSQLGQEIGVARDTVDRWMDLLEDGHIIQRVTSFLGGRRAELKSARKVYFLDQGVRNVLFGGFGPVANRADRGALAEGWVFSELLRSTGLLDSIRFWRTRHGVEVDFVVERAGRRLAVEVKAGKNDKLPKGARQFIELYEPCALLVVGAESLPQDTYRDTPVYRCQPWEVAPLVRALLAGEMQPD